MKVKIFVVLLLLLTIFTGCEKWNGFDGNIDSYKYYYSSDRERAWEEDILTFANEMLSSHAYFLDGPTQVICWENYWNENLLREDLRNQFIESVNQIILKIDKMEDYEIVWELQKSLNPLSDGHAFVFMELGEIFPVEFELFYNNDNVDLRVVKTTVDYENLLYSKLISINDVSLEEIIDKISKVLSYENLYALYSVIDNRGMNYTLRQKDVLVMLDVMTQKDNTATFVFENNGQTITVDLVLLDEEAYGALNKVGQTYQEVYTKPYSYRGVKNYWFEMDDEKNTMYIRIDYFKDDSQSLFVMVENIRKEIEQYDEVKVIIDLRGNPGGKKLDGYDRLIKVLNGDNIKSVYVLTDDSSASQSLIMTAKIKLEVPSSKIVGVPIGQATTMFGATHKVLPNSKIHYNVSGTMYRIYTEETFDVFNPDILIYPTIEDYRLGIDTILESVLNME